MKCQIQIHLWNFVVSLRETVTQHTVNRQRTQRKMSKQKNSNNIEYLHIFWMNGCPTNQSLHNNRTKPIIECDVDKSRSPRNIHNSHFQLGLCFVFSHKFIEWIPWNWTFFLFNFKQKNQRIAIDPLPENVLHKNKKHR